MKFLLTISLLLISMPALARAQPREALTRTETREAEALLAELGFWTGPIDGVFDAGSRSALIAFQKWHGRDVTGQLTIDELDVIRTSSRPGARELGYEHVEVDLDRQVLMLVADNGSVRVLPTSTGNGKTFMDDGQESISYTPRGRFLVYDKSVGWEMPARISFLPQLHQRRRGDSRGSQRPEPARKPWLHSHTSVRGARS